MTTSNHYTMLSLGTITAIMPDGHQVRHPLNFAFSGSASTLIEDTERQETIDALIRDNAELFSENLRAQGAEHIQCELRHVAQVL